MKLCISGANGFVGRTVTRDFRADGAQVVALVRSGTAAGEVEIGDLSIPGPAPSLPPCDVLIHLAALNSGIDDVDEQALRRFRAVNVEGTRRLLAAAITAGVGHVVFVSSVKVNGTDTAPGQAFRETDVPVPADAYAVSKMEAEGVVQSLCDRAGIAWTIVRPPLVYGEGVGGNMRQLARLAHVPLPLPLGGLRNSRSLLYVGNLSAFLRRVAADPRAHGQIYLVRDDHDVTTSELIDRIARAAGREARLFAVPAFAMAVIRKMRPSIVRRLTESLQIDDTKARRSLQWVPPFSLDDAISRSFGTP